MTRLRAILLGTLASARTDQPYALVDYPNYLNPGDAAIWLGAREALAAINGQPPAYSSTLRNFSPAQCRAAVGKGTLYFIGGGNFGDLYLRHHRARLSIIDRMPDNPIVQLPSSCAWNDAVDPAVLAETRSALARHSGVRFFARDPRSQGQLRNLLNLESVLCPDLAHALAASGPPPSIAVKKILRRDVEAASTPSGEGGSIDWRDASEQRFWNRFEKLVLMAAPPQAKPSLQDWIARKKVASAVNLVAQGQVLITDRLHAFLLGHAIGRPVVILDNTTGKVAAYHETWREHLSNVHSAPDRASALDLAASLGSAGS